MWRLYSIYVLLISRGITTIALSSTKVEYMVLSDYSHQVVWIKLLLGELGYNFKLIPIHDDNQRSLFIASNSMTKKRSKYIDTWYHYIHKVVADQKVTLFYIDGAENPADMFTKNLSQDKFLKFREHLGLVFTST